MTEAEWQSCVDVRLLVNHVYKLIHGERKLRLFAAACCRLLAPLLPDDRLVRVIEAVERYADGGITGATLRKWGKEADGLREEARDPGRAGFAPGWLAAHAVCYAAVGSSAVGYRHAGDGPFRHPTSFGEPLGTELRSAFVHLLRDIFGNPFRPITFLPEWRTSTVLALARQMYDTRDFSAMPILADALQDAGCEDEAILAHCRGPGSHVRGCQVVDAITGRS